MTLLRINWTKLTMFKQQIQIHQREAQWPLALNTLPVQVFWPMSCHSPLEMKLEVSPELSSPSSWRSMPLESYVHEPNFMLQRWSSNGNQLMSILHVLRNMPGGTQRQLPSEETTTFVGNVLSMSSSALHHTTSVNQSSANKYNNRRVNINKSPLQCSTDDRITKLLQ